MSKKLQGKVALVTGGSSGIGLATAQLFIDEGAYVFITGRRQSELDIAAKKLGKNASAIQGDVANLKDLDRVFATIKKQKGQIDVLFANAGIYEVTPFGSLSEELYDKSFDINVKGVFFTVQKALPIFKKGGAIILNASVAASKGVGGLSVYCASKAAVRSFARSWAIDLQKENIRVNAISPGVIPTPGFSNSFKMTEEQIRQFTESAAKMIPMGRTGTPEEIAKAVLFLASDDSSYLNGIDLVIDGGLMEALHLEK